MMSAVVYTYTARPSHSIRNRQCAVCRATAQQV